MTTITPSKSNDLNSPLLASASNITHSTTQPNFFGRNVTLIKHGLILTSGVTMSAATGYLILSKALIIAPIATGLAAAGFFAIYAIDKKYNQNIANAQRADLSLQHDSSYQSIADLESGLAKQNKLLLTAAEEKLETLSKENLTLGEKIADLDRLVPQLKAELETSKKDNESLQTDVNRLENEKKNLSEKLDYTRELVLSAQRANAEAPKKSFSSSGTSTPMHARSISYSNNSSVSTSAVSSPNKIIEMREALKTMLNQTSNSP